MKVIRKTLVAAIDTDFEFDIKGRQFLVKNFTNDSVLVQLYPYTGTIEIPANCSQVVVGNLANYIETGNKLIINSTVGGKVEVQCIEY